MNGIASGDRLGVGESAGNAGAGVAVQNFEGFFTEFGSPGVGSGGEKPLEILNRQLAGAESDELRGLRLWTGRQAPPKERRLSAARPKPPAKKRGPKIRIVGGLRERLCLLLSLGYSRRRAAATLGIAHTTINAAARRDADLAEALRRAEEQRRRVS